MKKGIMLIATVVFMSILIFLAVYNYPAVIILQANSIGENFKIEKKDTINPLEKLDMNSGKWEVYLVIDKYDLNDLDENIIRYKCLKSEDAEVIVEMKEKWWFHKTGGDITTATSSIHFLRDGETQFSSGIILGKDLVGLQSKCYGWIEPLNKESMLSSLKKFKKVRRPIVIL